MIRTALHWRECPAKSGIDRTALQRLADFSDGQASQILPHTSKKPGYTEKPWRRGPLSQPLVTANSRIAFCSSRNAVNFFIGAHDETLSAVSVNNLDVSPL
jgi:hypothetical protein